MADHEWLTVEEAAEILGIQPRSVRNFLSKAARGRASGAAKHLIGRKSRVPGVQALTYTHVRADTVRAYIATRQRHEEGRPPVKVAIYPAHCKRCTIGLQEAGYCDDCLTEMAGESTWSIEPEPVPGVRFNGGVVVGNGYV